MIPLPIILLACGLALLGVTSVLGACWIAGDQSKKEMKTTITVKFAGNELHFWEKKEFQKHVASTVTEGYPATGFPDQAQAEAAVKKCRLDEAQITYHIR